ncbi:SPOR domain-containing protein [Sulfitobacter aestuarii]|uniref:SPOR domain-containing protein n=1 Tax=Sulfitobacter aestuarii TaxID=2161676 RepID=A0ABW5U0Z3_9RHOB
MIRPDPRMRGTRRPLLLLSVGTVALSLLAGCGEGGRFSLGSGGESATGDAPRSTRLVERDVEAPDVFSVTEEGLWDGRPSLGGVWVAHPDVKEPERVIIRNQQNEKFVIGALFRRERDLPGPSLQISSDAAAALDVLAGAPAPLNVTALRRQEQAPEAETETGAEEDSAVDELALAAPSAVREAMLEPAAATGDAAPSGPVSVAASTAKPPATRPAPAAAAKPARAPGKTFVQIGIFSVEANATRTGKQMRAAGMVPTIKRSEINGKPFWRVLVGPAASPGERDKLLKAIKAEGFSDAYAVSN